MNASDASDVSQRILDRDVEFYYFLDDLELYITGKGYMSKKEFTRIADVILKYKNYAIKQTRPDNLKDFYELVKPNMDLIFNSLPTAKEIKDLIQEIFDYCTVQDSNL